MKEFILGIIFIIAFQPIIDGLTSLFLTWLESIKCIFAVKIAEKNQKIEILSMDEPQYTIGFAAPEEEEYENNDL